MRFLFAAVAVLLLVAGNPRLRRWFLGRPLDGKLRTNATWNRKATRVLHPTGYALWWHHWRQRDLAALRTLGTLGVALTAAGLLVARTATIATLAAGALAFAALHVPAAVARGRDWRHHRTWVRPLHRALTFEMGIPPARLEIAPDRSKVVVGLPVEFTGSDGACRAVTQAVTAKLAIEAPDADWSLDHKGGKKSQVTYTKSKPPPRDAVWDDVARLVDEAGADEVVFGLGKERAPVKASLAADSPHVAFNMGSGGGKTNLGSFCALQFLHRGDVVGVIDAKLISYPCLRGLPNVAYAGMIPEVHDLLVWFGVELKRRNSVALAGLQPSGAIRADVGPRMILFAEELNFVIPQLKRYWADMRADDKALPKRSPALDAIGDVAFAGRQVLMHIFFIGQMITAAATGANDSSVRGNIGISCMARYTPSSWSKMTSVPMPPVPTVPGRIQVVTASGTRETQVPYLHLDDKDEAVAAVAAEWARQFAVSGTFTECPAGMPGAVAVPGVPMRPQLEQGGSEQPLVPGTPELPPTAVTLAKARELDIIRLSKAAANKASQRPGFPEPIGMDGIARLFDALELKAWQDGKVKVYR